jgi:hypothetical protein
MTVMGWGRVHDWMGRGGGIISTSAGHTVGAEYHFKLIIKLTPTVVCVLKIIQTHRLLLYSCIHHVT